MRRVNPRNRLLVALAVILSLAFVGVSVINYNITKAAVHSEILQKDLPLTMSNIYSELTAELTRPILVASSMAADTFLKDWVQDGETEPEKIQKYLAEIKESYGFFTAFFVSAHTSSYYHFKGVHKQIDPGDAHDVWYYRFIASGKEYDLDVDTDETSNNVLTLFINYRVSDESGRLLGVTGVGLKIDTVARLVTNYQERFNRNVYLTDKQGIIQVHRDTSLIEKSSIADQDGLKGHTAAILSLPADPVYYEYIRDGEKILLNVRYIKELDWLLFVEQSETRALLLARMNFWRTITIGICASVLVIFLTLLTINRYQSKVEKLVILDELTGIANRRKLENEFSKAVYSYSRNQQPISIILMDLDGFKDVNDLLGHMVGDAVLKRIATRIGEAVRPTDTLARWGGDEFALLTTSNLEETVQMAERIRIIVEQLEWPDAEAKGNDPRERLTVSCGVIDFADGDSLDTLLRQADQALYRSKAEGGNRVKTSESAL
jgi:diguanylate cyclase (GGDEF)-like protein